VILVVDADLMRDLALELTLRSFVTHAAVADIDGDVLRDADGHLADTRHVPACLRLPDVGQDFAAHLQAARPYATHDALRRRQDGRPKAAKDTWDARRRRVHAQTRLADALDAHQHRIATASAGRITQVNAQNLVDAFAALLERIDVA